MTRAEYDKLPSNGQHQCPDCGSKRTHPCGGCGCPPQPTGLGTKHINLFHHTCAPKLDGEKVRQLVRAVLHDQSRSEQVRLAGEIQGILDGE